MPRTFSATRKFRLKILACMLKPRWIAKYGSIIEPKYFERRDENEFADIILEFWNDYGFPPTDSDDVLAIIDPEYKELVHTVYMGMHDWDLTLASDTAVQFAREQAAKIAVLSSLQDVERGELDVVIEKLQEALKVGQDLGNLGLDLKADDDKWLAEVQSEKIPTGMIHLDIALEGGLASGELGVFLAPPNYGKSLALVNVGHGAMGPISRCNVVHFTLEMAEHVVAKRYAARSIFRFPNRSGDLSEYKEDFRRTASLMLPGNVRIFRVSGTVNVMRSQLNILIDSGYDPDLIIVDYGDEVDPIRHRNNLYNELGDIFKSLRELGFEFNCPVWTATMSNRSSLNKEFITMADLADSFKKAAKADAIVAICQTRDEEVTNQCRLFLAKLRDGESRALISAKYFKKQQAIITTGFA